MTTSRLVVLGATGQLGADLVPVLRARERWNVTPLGPEDVDVRDAMALTTQLDALAPTVVVNATGYNRVDDAETDAPGAFALNAIAVHTLARWCRAHDATLVHVSTDFVFGGDASRTTPYREGDAPAPQSVYATSKLAGELLVQAAGIRHLIVRTSGLYGGAERERGDMSPNFVLTMLRAADAGKRLRVVDDQRLTPTPTRELALKLGELIAANVDGLVHVTSEGECSWYEFATELFRLAGIRPALERTTSREWNAPASRPRYCVLRSERLAALGVAPLRPWQDGLADYLRFIGRLRD